MQATHEQHGQADSGLQPERTSLAWFRTLSGYVILGLLIIKHHSYKPDAILLVVLLNVFCATVILWRFIHHRRQMDADVADFTLSREIRSKACITLAVCILSLVFVSQHFQQIILFLTEK